MIPYMSSEKSSNMAKRLRDRVNDDINKFTFTNLDTNNDSFVNVGEIFTWLESFSKKVTKEEFLTSQLDYVSAFKRGQENSQWGKPMDYETFKLYWTLYFVSDARIFHEVFDENGNGIMDEDDWNRMQIWSSVLFNTCIPGKELDDFVKILNWVLTDKLQEEPTFDNLYCLTTIEYFAISFSATTCE